MAGTVTSTTSITTTLGARMVLEDTGKFPSQLLHHHEPGSAEHAFAALVAAAAGRLDQADRCLLDGLDAAVGLLLDTWHAVAHGVAVPDRSFSVSVDSQAALREAARTELCTALLAYNRWIKG
ncbi:hypothetical protein [Embleya sp. NPDC059237]|uniref:hypothetical protein n=1 Tax=Embleya sp. NPDC059237 TaxID=3346784 RepID=UPI0036C48EC5